MQKVAEQAAEEARYYMQTTGNKRHALVMRAPNADLARDPRWGRTEESFGEDAFLTAQLTIASVRGLQGNHPRYWKTASLMKHFLANSNEDGRDSTSSDFDTRLFHEYYAYPFYKGITEGGSRAFMAAYNSWNGIPMSIHPCLKEITRKQWGNNGIICTDGGALKLLKTITAVYLRLKGHEISNTCGVLDINEPPRPEEMEDAYIKYASSRVKRPRSQGKAYRIRGHREPFYTLNIIHGLLSVQEVLQKARSYHVTLTEYLNAVLLYALLEKQKADHVFREHPVALALPVNLRNIFPSDTLRNFIAMVYPSVDPRMGDYTFEEIITHVHNYMRFYINDKFLNADITTNASTQQSPLIRIVPLFVKDIVVKQFYIRVQDKQSTAGLTNLGVIDVPKEMREFVDYFDVLMGQPFSLRTNCAVGSFGDTLSINFTSTIIETDVERFFFRKLVQEGLHVKIETNRDMNRSEF